MSKRDWTKILFSQKAEIFDSIKARISTMTTLMTYKTIVIPCYETELSVKLLLCSGSDS